MSERRIEYIAATVNSLLMENTQAIVLSSKSEDLSAIEQSLAKRKSDYDKNVTRTHRSLPELKAHQEKLAKDPRFPKKGERYRHYKGNIYEVDMVVMREENESPEVIYHGTEDPNIWSWGRLLSDWNESVMHNGEWVPRFSPIIEVDACPIPTNFRKIAFPTESYVYYPD